MFLRWIGLTASILMCTYAASYLFDARDASLNEVLRRMLTMLCALLLLFWSLTGIWSRKQITKFTWWTYRMAIKKAFDCEYRAYSDYKSGRTSSVSYLNLATRRRTNLEKRYLRERGIKDVRRIR